MSRKQENYGKRNEQTELCVFCICVSVVSAPSELRIPKNPNVSKNRKQTEERQKKAKLYILCRVYTCSVVRVFVLFSNMLAVLFFKNAAYYDVPTC